MINSHFSAATDEAGRVSPVAPAGSGRGAGNPLRPSAAAPALRGQRRQKLKCRARREDADKSRPAPVQAREMGGPRAGLMVRPRDPSDVLL
jgi:hypothetical protein